MAEPTSPWFTSYADLLKWAAAPTGSTSANVPGYLPLYQANMPLTGFLGPQRTPGGGFATWLNMGANLDGLEWLIPLLTPNQAPSDIQALTQGQSMDPAHRRQVEDLAVQFARQYEQQNPGTFAKYPTSIEADVEAMDPIKNLFYRSPPVPPAYPGR